ncbi:Meiosis-specific with OB domain-containing protein [Holothuria leucospilota]|uniref:Meiosis-specific with OB domain-containing protein n=1 Tax=Holothuria leucospilota TaxID=206669 RepID=A0A9Q1C321_HOLLE|nr:Meiosis-specific with OB domain-containing protein [Holothuria leucospilota]
MSWANNMPSEFGTQSAWPDGTAISVKAPRSSMTTDTVTALKDLWPQTPDVNLIGIILAKQTPRVIASKTNPGAERAVFNFTLRDSPVDFINISCWGRKSFIKELARKYRIGDIVRIHNPQIMPKPNTENEERYHPWTPSHFQLSFSELHSSIELCGSWDTNRFSNLAHIPVCDSKEFHNLCEILSNGQNLNQQNVNILAMIKQMGSPKDIVTKAGKHVKRCEVKLFDETCASMAMIMWDEPIIEYAQHNWMDKETVIFAVDVLAKFDDFRHTMTLTVTGKSIFTTNPDTKEAHTLYKYGKSIEFDDDQSNDYTSSVVNLSTIKDVYNIAQLQQKISETLCQVEYGLTYAFLTAFDVDGPVMNVTSLRCSKCKYRVHKDTGICNNPSCPFSLADTAETTLIFDMRVNLSDHTGTITGTYLGGKVAQEMLGCTEEEFLQLTEQRKTELKWNYLLERCKVYFKIVPSGFNGANNVLRLLSCEQADSKEVYNNLKLI